MDNLALLRFESNLAETVFRSGAGGFCVEVDEHLCPLEYVESES